MFGVSNGHRLGRDIPLQSLGFEAGYAGPMAQPFNDQDWGFVHLHWQQGLKQGRVTVLAGAVGVTDHVDAHGLADLWIQFSNLAFRVSPPIAVPSRGALGVAAGAMATDNLYVVAGLADNNADPTDPEGGFNAKVPQRASGMTLILISLYHASTGGPPCICRPMTPACSIDSSRSV